MRTSHSMRHFQVASFGFPRGVSWMGAIRSPQRTVLKMYVTDSHNYSTFLVFHGNQSLLFVLSKKCDAKRPGIQGTTCLTKEVSYSYCQLSHIEKLQQESLGSFLLNDLLFFSAVKSLKRTASSFIQVTQNSATITKQKKTKMYLEETKEMKRDQFHMGFASHLQPHIFTGRLLPVT